jgi:glutamate racemase
MPKIKIGVFDSGVGGIKMARAIQKELPDAEIVNKSDTQYFPYGNRTTAEIYQFTKPLIKELVDEGCQVIVIACNTVTTNLIENLRQEFSLPFVGMEPMIKPAAELTKSKVVAVCATPRTLASKRYNYLKETYASDIKVLEPDCSDWAQMIESNNINQDKIKKTVDEVCSLGADVIVLGCTHYHWIEELIREQAEERAQVLQPEVPVIAQLKAVLSGL